MFQLFPDFGAHTGTSDIDFEYPANEEQAAGHANLLTELRTALNDLASRKGDKEPYLLSVRVPSLVFTLNDADKDTQAAVPAGWANYEKLKIRQIDAALDFWNLMVSGRTVWLSVPAD